MNGGYAQLKIHRLLRNRVLRHKLSILLLRPFHLRLNHLLWLGAGLWALVVERYLNARRRCGGLQRRLR